MRKRLIQFPLVLLAAVAVQGQTTREADLPPVMVTAAGSYNAERQIITLGIGRDEGVSIGDRFWLFKDDSITGTGSVFLVGPTQSVGRLGFTGKGIGSKQAAAVLVGGSLQSLRRKMSPDIAIRAQVARVPPARRTAWLSFGRRSGVKPGDPVVIRRFGLPISRGRLEIVDEEVSLAELQPLVGNTLPQVGDDAEIWPPPGVDLEVRLSSAVLDVTSSREGPVITFPGTAADGLTENRLVDIFRKGQYLGVAAVRQIYDPLSQALVMESATRSAPEIGDTVVVRLRPGYPPKPLTAVVFKVAGDYCLIAAGESDGVQPNERFVVRGPVPGAPESMREVAELTVEAVKVDYSGARIRPLIAESAPVRTWDMAERRTTRQKSQWVYAGRIDLSHAESRTLVISPDPEVDLSAGQVVRWTPPQADAGQSGAAIIVYMGGDKGFLYVPPAWGDLAEAPGARIEILSDSHRPSAASTPATSAAGTRPASE